MVRAQEEVARSLALGLMFAVVTFLQRHRYAVVGGLALLAVGTLAALPSRDVTIDVLDIGQGDAVLIQDGYEQMLIDGGPDDSVLAALGDTMPAFDRLVEAIVLTHPHADHYAGLIAVLKRYEVGTIYLSDATVGTGAYGAFTRAAAESGARTVEVRAGDRLRVGRRTEGVVLWPPSDPTERAATIADEDENARSIVLRIEVSSQAALLTGDATPDVEAALVAQDAVALRADFLKVAHHGSRFSSTADFLAAVQSEYAAISVGAKNGYGHPGWPALRRLESVGMRVFRTDLDGNIRARFTAAGVTVYASGK